MTPTQEALPVEQGDDELATIISCMDEMLADPRLDALAFDKHDSHIIRRALAGTAPEASEAVAWLVERKGDRTFPLVVLTEAEADQAIAYVTLPPLLTKRPLYASPQPTAGHVEAQSHDWWLAVAKSAGEHGVRYRTNSALVDFLADVAALTATSPAPPELGKDTNDAA